MKTYHYLLKQSPVIDVWLVSSPLQLKSLSNTCLSVLCRLCTSRAGFPGGAVVRNPPADAGDTDSIPGPGRSPGEGNGNPLQYSGLKNPMDRGGWRAPAPGAESDRLSAQQAREGACPPTSVRVCPPVAGPRYCSVLPLHDGICTRGGPPTAKVNCWHVVCVA